MLEGVAVTVLNMYLPRYVKNFNSKDLSIGIVSGSYQIKNLELKRDILDQLNPSVYVSKGHVGLLNITIPWNTLITGASVKIVLEDVFLLVAPKEDAEWDEEAEEQRKQALKIDKLNSAEQKADTKADLLKNQGQEPANEEEQKKNLGFLDKVMKSMLANIQVTIKNIHVRYEDSVSSPGHPFAFGLTLAGLSGISTDEQWKPAYIQDTSKPVHKLVTLDKLAAYWNTDAELLGSGRETEVPGAKDVTDEELLRKFKELIVNSEDSSSTNHQFVLKPVSGRAKVLLDDKAKIERTVGLVFDEIAVSLDDDQYRDGVMLADYYWSFRAHQKYKKYRPKDVSPKEDPKAWLKFAGDAVLREIHDRNRRWSWSFFKERRDNRVRYIELFKKQKKAAAPLTGEEQVELKKIEFKQTYEDLWLWRLLGKKELKKENATVKTTTTPQKQGWVAWAWGSKPQQNEENAESLITDEQRKALYDVIDWDEKQALANTVDVPKDTVKFQIDTSLRTGSLTLRRDPHSRNLEVVGLYFDQFRAKFQLRPQSWLADVKLGGMLLVDGTTPNTHYREIVRVKDAPDTPSDRLLLDGADEDVEDVVDPFFQFQFENNPLDGSSDSALSGTLKPLEVIWNPHFVEGILIFFRPPDDHMESISALMKSAGATVETIRQQTIAGLEYAIERHKTVNVKLDLQAPLLIIPESVTSKTSACMILDAGHVSVNSELVDEDTRKEVQSIERQSYTDEYVSRLEAASYDKFLVKLSSAQLLIGPSIQEAKTQLIRRDPSLSMHLVEKINVDFTLEISMLPINPKYPRMRLSGNLPVGHAIFSDKSYKAFMRIILGAIPNFNKEEPPAEIEQAKGPVVKRPRPQSSLSIQQVPSRDRTESTSFPFSDQEAFTIQESDDDDDEEFQDASPGNMDENSRIYQRQFELNFRVERLQGSLYVSDPAGVNEDKLLVEIIGKDVGVDVCIRPFDITVEPSIGSIVVDDFVENPSAEFKSIISSGVDTSETQSPFIRMKLIKVNRESPQFMTEYDGVEINIDITMSNVNLVVTRRTLLTLLDFIMVTFTNNDPQPQQIENNPDTVDGPSDADTLPKGNQQEVPLSVRIKVNLQSAHLILNNDGIRLATLSLIRVDVGIFVLGKTTRITAKIGDLALLDDVNQGASGDSSLRKLMTIQGEELAHFRYENFDPENAETFPGYDHSVFLHAGSIKLNFVEEPFRKITEFLVKFGKMQAIFNAARQAAANQANQIQNSPARFKFDINVKTPIVVFPRVMKAGRPKRDLLTAYLGEIYAENVFVPLDDSKDSPIAMKISAGISNIRLTSEFQFDDDKSEELEMIDKVDINFAITYAEHTSLNKRPDLEALGNMTGLNLRITQLQLRFLVELAKSIPAAFVIDTENDQIEDLSKLVKESPEPSSPIAGVQSAGNTSLASKPAVQSDENWTKLDLAFQVHSIGLELLLAKDDEPVGDLDMASLSKFSLDDTKLKLRMMTDGSLESELLIQAFTIKDSRKQETSRFRTIMTSNKDVQQFMASVTISGGQERNMVAIVEIDSPKVIFALDYIFEVQAYFSEGIQAEESLAIEDDESIFNSGETSDADSTAAITDLIKKTRTPTSAQIQEVPQAQESSMSIAFRVNVVDAQVMLIANPLSSSSEAIVLRVKQVLLSQQHSLTLQLSQIGMFLCCMDRIDDSRSRILDDFAMQMSMDSSRIDLTSLHIDIEPLVLRLSLRDIKLALQIVRNASESSGRNVDKDGKPSAAEEKARHLQTSSSLERRSPSGKVASTMGKKTKAVALASSKDTRSPVTREVRRHEELTANSDGMRVILIGDVHELPILELSVKNFTASATDWSSNLNVSTDIDTFIDIYNFSRSAWEPLIEPWHLGLQISQAAEPECLSIDLTSPKMLELTVTSATIALASKSADFFSKEEDLLSKPRGAETPYRIRNYTGFELSVWASISTDDNNVSVKLDDGQDAPWRFLDREQMRESTSAENNTGVVGIRLEGSGFDSINSIPVNREGETLYNLRPKKDAVQHHILVEVTLGQDNVKNITFRSPLLLENRTQIPVELGVFDAEEGHLLKIEKIAPGESRAAPVGAAYEKRLVVRPDQGFGYTWSTETLWWRDLLKRSTRTISCKGENDQQKPPFYFQMSANFDKANPVSSKYPHMRIRLSAPIELENLLPYDFKYRIYDRNTKKDWTNFLRKGGVSPVHVVELSHLLLMSIDMQDTVFKASEFAIINSNNQEDFRQESNLVCKDNEGLALSLKLHYFRIPDSGGAFKVTVYSPYVILNKTGLEISIKAKSLLQQARTAAGQGLKTDAADSERQRALPYMFAYASDDQRNRALLKVGDSSWSKPQTFDAIGSTNEVVLPSSSKNSEIHIGIDIQPGEGKYKLTKVVTLAPRFVLKNQMSEEIIVREPGSSELFKLKPQALQPLHFLQKSAAKQLALCFPGVNNQWSSPFNISDVGVTHVKLAKTGQRQKLVRVEVLLENATIFLHLSLESKVWPFSMRNESDTEFMFYQANPNIDDEVEDRSGWRPIRYRLPPRSIMPYAWDYPAAKQKELVITAFGKERHIKLAEIGNLLPMKISTGPNPREQKIIDLNVAADGPTQTLILANYRASKSLYKQTSQTQSSTSVAGGFKVKDQDTGINFRAQIKLAGVGISLINHQLKELAYITFRDVSLGYAASPLYETFTTSIKWIQIDNQLYGGIFPMILYPSVVPKNTKETESHPSIHLQLTHVKDDSYGVYYVKYATVLLQQMTLEIDEDFVYAVLDFAKIPGASWSEANEGTLCDDSLDIPEPKQQQQGQDIYFELLNIQPMQLDLSFVRTERVNVEDKSSSRNPLMYFLNVLTMAMGNINDAPIRLNSLMLENARVSSAVLLSNVSTHYTQEALYQVHKVLGSADFLGNPVGLFNNLSSGVADIFYEPYQGFILSADRPEQLGLGIAKGATSFVKKSVFGFSDSFSKVTGSIAKGLAEATMDKQFQDRRRMTRARNRPKHALYGVTAGANSFVSSLASGVGGLARKPLEGAEQEGVAGFFKGVGKGVLGLATKPAIGVFDLASNVSEGIRNTTTVFDADGLDRVRLTRFIGQDGVVRPYSQREALGQFWLKQLDNGKYFNESYIAHLELPREDLVVMLTYSRILLIRAKKLTSDRDVPLKDIQVISKERAGLALTLKGGTAGPFIPVGEESSRNFLYKKIGVAVGEFNKRYQANA